MAYNLDTVNKLSKLKIRNEPHWDVLGKGKSLGYRKTATGGTWKARFRQDSKSIYRTLGDGLTFEQAKALAETWYLSVTGAENHRYTLESCIIDYLDDLGTRSSERSVYDARMRMNKHLSERLLSTRVSDLTTTQLERWHRSMVKKSADEETVRRSKDSANRNLATLKAALNNAYRTKTVSSNDSWGRVQAFKSVSASRKVFLTDDELKRLLSASKGEFKTLLTAAILTGARYGELAAAIVEDFDSSANTLDLKGKTGARTVILSDQATAFFKQVTKTKLPKASLLSKDDGSNWRKGNQRNPWDKVKVTARLPEGSVFYSLRHYHISKALLSGMPIQAIAENCGTSVRMIEKHYGKFLGEDKREMMNRVALGVG